MRNATPDILVTGGTGFIGSYLLRYLVQNGYTRIRALRRPNSKMDMVAEIQDKIEWVECDLLDVLGLEEAMEGIRYVYHCAALVSMNRRDAQRLIEVNREGTANMVNWSLEKGVEKFLHVSSIAAIGHNKHAEFIDENCHWERSGKLSYYALSKYQAEQEVWRGVAEGLNAVVVNPSVVLGSGRWKEGP
ncbi:MAG: NAD-dependent epimerase/dehydratase family protein [Saprospiraceae bacterium]|nr:NAD-dependent epimerase/dehydratase family protein [Saprospiraceae bacterium]